MWLRIALLVALLWSVENVSAQSFSSCAGGAKITYVNGVNTPNVQTVSDSADVLATRIADFGISCVAEVAFYHNLSEGWAADILKESALQKATELGITIAEATLNILLVWSGLPAPLFPENTQNEIHAQLVTLIQSASLSNYSFIVNGISYTTADVVNDIRDRTINDLQQYAGVVLVGHSQGNFFVNSAYSAGIASTPEVTSKRISVVNVANASINAPSGLYVSSHQDPVIQALSRIAYALEPNFDVGAVGHSFVGIYLNRFLPENISPANSVAAKVMEYVQVALDRIRYGTAPTAYQQSFATDPEWQTDQPANFFWNSTAQTYFARTYSGVPATSPNRYATIELPTFDPNRGFNLEWDQRVNAVNDNAQVHFGLYSSDRLAERVSYVGLPALIPESTVNFSLGYSNSGNTGFHSFNVVSASGADLGQSGSGGPVAEFGRWYRMRLSYSPSSGQVQVSVNDIATGVSRLTLTRPAVGTNLFSAGMRYLGIANHPTGYHPGLIWATTPNGYLDTEFDNVVLTYDGTSRSSVIFAQTGTDQSIPYGAVTDFYGYYFMGYDSLGNPPVNARFWTVTREFDTVRVKRTGGTATCAQIGNTAQLFDDIGNTFASLEDGTADGQYCVFSTYRGGQPSGAIPVGTRIGGIFIGPSAPGVSFSLAGSASNSGRSVNGFNTADRPGGFAFQFCAGPCDEPMYNPTLTVSPRFVRIGGSTTIAWSIGDAPLAECRMTRSGAPLPYPDAQTGSFVLTDVQGRSIYTLTCGSNSVTAVVEVIPEGS